MARDLVARLRPHAEELGCASELEGIEDLLANGSGAHRQLAIADGGADLSALVAEIASFTRP